MRVLTVGLVLWATPLLARVVWRGWASDRIRRNPSQEESEQRVRDVVAKVMEQFPPR